MRPETDPDPGWVESLSGASRGDSLEAVEEAREENRLFSHLSREHDREGRDSYVEIDAPLELHALVRLLRPAHVVEVGVSSGVSSAYLLNGLEKNRKGTLHSIDLPSFSRRKSAHKKAPRVSWGLPPGKFSGWAVPLALRKRWDLRIGDKAQVLPVLAGELPTIGLFVYDVPHDDTVTRRELRLIDSLVPPGGVVIIDHGPGGGLCAALASWARSRGTHPVRREGLGLYGARVPLSFTRSPEPRGARRLADTSKAKS
jgi:hypothetical protein